MMETPSTHTHEPAPPKLGASYPVAVEPRFAERVAIVLLVGFLLIFPKGGIKFADVPITWGYLLLGLTTLSLPIALFRGKPIVVARDYLWLTMALVPFQAVVWLALIVNGVTGYGFAISLLVTFFFIPPAFLLVVGPALQRLDLGLLFRLLRGGILFVSAYGIFLFFYRLATGAFIEIPYLTVNAGDFGDLDAKFIDRGGIFKLISTYNNGNIYGVSLLLLLPLYAWLERRKVPVGILKLSLLLTLSRTVWIGLIFYEVLHRVYVRPLQMRSLLALAASLSLVVLGVLGALQLMGAQLGFIFDANLGGRVQQFESLQVATVLPERSFEHILEMVYLSVLDNFGALGLFSFLAAMSAPLILHFVGAFEGGGGVYKRSLAAGLMTYLVVCLSDGALLFIPVMAFYWFIVALLAGPDRTLAGGFANTGKDNRLAMVRSGRRRALHALTRV